MNYKHFTNQKCEYFPCHGIENQNCLFCYCPLYFFHDCGGAPKWKGNVKDCSSCTKNHDENSYQFIMERLGKAFGNLKENGEMLTLDRKIK